MFSMREIIDLAVQIERNGEKVYRAAVERLSDAPLMDFLKRLADDELRHAQWFSDLRVQSPVAASTPEVEELTRRLLGQILGEQSFSLNEKAFGPADDLEDLIRRSLDFERDTVLFYQMIGSLVDDEEILSGLNSIIQEEKRHITELEGRLPKKGQSLT